MEDSVAPFVAAVFVGISRRCSLAYGYTGLFAVMLFVAVVSAVMADQRRDSLTPSASNALERAGQFLLAKQCNDGAWRSETYGALRDGPSLTPLVASAMFFLGRNTPAALDAYRRGADYLVAFAREDGTIDAGARELDFPVYTAAGTAWCLKLENRGPKQRAAQRAWLRYALDRRLGAGLGWRSADLDFGGWGYSVRLPRKAANGEFQPDAAANISATLFGISALLACDVPRTDPIYAEALTFVKRCQNFNDDPAQTEPVFDDGGFFFSPTDAARNKAGPSGKDSNGRDRFASYGSATCDGLRALLHCGLARDHPRVVAAERWLSKSFSVANVPGRFAPDREALKDGYYFYYCWSLAHAMTALGSDQLDAPRGKIHWAPALAAELVRRQQPDGAWVNRFTDAKEDDPLIATPFAVAALVLCLPTLAPYY